MRRLIALVVFLECAGVRAAVYAESREPFNTQNLQAQVEVLHAELRQLKTLVGEQQKRIQTLEGGDREAQQLNAQLPSETLAALGSPSTKKTAGAMLPFIPDIGVVGDIVGTASKTLPDDEGNNRVSVRELELVVGSDIDPYSRFDTTLSFSDFEEAELEEAYVSYWDLPADSKMRIGRYHQPIGKAASVHRDSLDTVEEPLVVQSYLGEHGIHQTGFDIAGFTPLSEDAFVQYLTIGIMEGGSGHGGTLFGSEKGKATLFGHLANSWTLRDDDSLELGASYLLGANEDNQSFKVNVLGVDASYVHRLPSQKRFKLQSEFFLQNRSGGHSHEEEHEILALKHSEEEEHEDEESEESYVYDSNSSGLYALADLRFSQRWGFGTRYDWVQPIELAHDYPRRQDQAFSAYLTFYQSEFARWRLQYQYANLADGEEDNRFFLQGTFAIGTHKHQIQ